MLMSWTLGWAFGICGLGLLVQIIIFYYFNFLSQLVYVQQLLLKQSAYLVTYNFS